MCPRDAATVSAVRPPSDRAVRDAHLIPQLVALFKYNYRVCGARKIWTTAHRVGLNVGRDGVARLMRATGIKGA